MGRILMKMEPKGINLYKKTSNFRNLRPLGTIP